MLDCLIVANFVVDFSNAVLIGCILAVGVIDSEDHIVGEPARHQRSLPLLLVTHDVLHELCVMPRDVG